MEICKGNKVNNILSGLLLALANLSSISLPFHVYDLVGVEKKKSHNPLPFAHDKKQALELVDLNICLFFSCCEVAAAWCFWKCKTVDTIHHSRDMTALMNRDKMAC